MHMNLPASEPQLQGCSDTERLDPKPYGHARVLYGTEGLEASVSRQTSICDMCCAMGFNHTETSLTSAFALSEDHVSFE